MRGRRFTLVELMIVVAIMMVLAAIAIPALANYQLRAKRSEAVVLTDSLKNALDATRHAHDDVADITTSYIYNGCSSVPRILTATDKTLVDWLSATDCDLVGFRPDGAVRCSYTGGDFDQIEAYCDVDDDNVLALISLTWEDSAGVGCSPNETNDCSWVLSTSAASCPPFSSSCDIY